MQAEGPMYSAGSMSAAGEVHRSLRQAQGRLFAAKNAAQDDKASLDERIVFKCCHDCIVKFGADLLDRLIGAIRPGAVG